MNIDVKYLRVGDVHQPCLCVFDVLFYNGKVLTNKPLNQRLTILEDIFTPLEGIVMHTPRRDANSGCVKVSSCFYNLFNGFRLQSFFFKFLFLLGNLP